MGRYDDAIGMLSERRFAVAEGPNLNLAEHWTEAHLLRGRGLLAAGKPGQALADFRAAAVIPPTLPAVETGGTIATPEISYWVAAADAALGDRGGASESCAEALRIPPAGPGRDAAKEEPEINAGAATQFYYAALCRRQLGQEAAARAIFARLLDAGTAAQQPSTHQPARPESATREISPRARAAGAHYAIALGALGLGDRSRAEREFALAVETSPDLLAARAALAALRR